jgi:TonB family protein
MNKNLFVLMVFCIFTASAQTSVLDYSLDRIPEVYGGSVEYKRFLEYHMMYPEDEIRTKTEGKVVIEFVVSSEGKIRNAKIIERVSPLLNMEAIRLFNLLLWTPAVKEGKEIDYAYTIDIPFKISKYKKGLKYRGDNYQELMARMNKVKKPNKKKGEKAPALVTLPPDSSNIIYEVPDKPAKYFYGNDSLQKYVLANLDYPNIAKTQGIEGTVYLSMIVETNGFVSNIKPDKSVGGGCNEEAERLMGQTIWKPAEKDGRLVRSKIVCPISFRIMNTFHDNSFSEQK